MKPTVPEDLRRVGLLADDQRWRIYSELREADHPLNRQEIAERVGMAVRTVTFHLERLLEGGLLEAVYIRPPGRAGPGAGRTAKYYRPAQIDLNVSVPSRRYELLGDLLISSAESSSPGEPWQETAERLAFDRGRTLGERHRRDHAQDTAEPSALSQVLRELGYEPYSAPWGGLALHNCPFHALAQRSPQVVCAVNFAFLRGVLQGLGDHVHEPVLACWQPGDCCVLLQSVTESSPTPAG